MAVYSRQSTIKVGRDLVNVIQSASKSNEVKREFGQTFFQTAMFSSSYEQPKSKQWFYRNFALHVQHYWSVEIRRVKIVLITAAEAASCCFFISGVMVEAEMILTTNVQLI